VCNEKNAAMVQGEQRALLLSRDRKKSDRGRQTAREIRKMQSAFKQRWSADT